MGWLTARGARQAMAGGASPLVPRERRTTLRQAETGERQHGRRIAADSPQGWLLQPPALSTGGACNRRRCPHRELSAITALRAGTTGAPARHCRRARRLSARFLGSAGFPRGTSRGALPQHCGDPRQRAEWPRKTAPRANAPQECTKGATRARRSGRCSRRRQPADRRDAKGEDARPGACRGRTWRLSTTSSSAPARPAAFSPTG